MSRSKAKSGKRDKDDTLNPDFTLSGIGNYNFVKTVGEGNFAKVKLATHKVTGGEVAIKVIDKTTMDEKKVSKLYREVRIMKMLHHPNIVKLYEVIETKYTVFLVMEYASGGELYDYLVVHGKMKEKDARVKFRQILSAVNYCHKKRVIHRDLKAENLLLDANLDIKIADFGFSNYFDPDLKLDTFCGSPPYAAPELFQGRVYTGPEVDIWSLGVILYVLTTGSLPFDGENLAQMRESVCKGKYRVPFFLSDNCEKLLKKFLVRDPAKRNSLDILITDAWINESYPDSPIIPESLDISKDDDVVISIMASKYKYEKSAILEALRDNVYNELTAIYYLLQNDKDIKASIAQQNSAPEVTQITSPAPKHAGLTTHEKENAMPKIGEDEILEGAKTHATTTTEVATTAHERVASVSANTSMGSAVVGIRKRAATVNHKYAVAETTPVVAPVAAPVIAPLVVPEQVDSGESSAEPPVLSTTTASSIAQEKEKPRAVKRNHSITGMIMGIKKDDSTSNSQTPNASDDGDKPRSLRFTFNSNTTSSKTPDEIVVELVKAGNKLNLTHRLATRYVLECTANATAAPGKDPLKMEVEVCKLPRLNNLHGLRFKRINGATSDYKEVSEQILATIVL